MPSLQLFYQRFRIGFALIDPELERLKALGINFGISIPRTIYRMFDSRTDVMLSAFRDDDTLLPRCSPFTQIIAGRLHIPLKLSHIAVRPRELIPVLESYTIAQTPSQRELTIDQLRLITSTIPRLTHVNRSRVDCRVSNLRELNAESPALSANEGSES